MGRAQAAQDFPDTELYLAFDGGSGYEFWLPHLAAADVEGPNKAADNVHCPNFKVFLVLPVVGEAAAVASTVTVTQQTTVFSCAPDKIMPFLV